jgi:hypothetical protein
VTRNVYENDQIVPKITPCMKNYDTKGLAFTRRFDNR